ncbi:MAG TPA: hypothetical protein VFE22_00425 [Edaphobacter sp.]|nr:hypothetical protein [Edaphobacter sp.]
MLAISAPLTSNAPQPLLHASSHAAVSATLCDPRRRRSLCTNPPGKPSAKEQDETEVDDSRAMPQPRRQMQRCPGALRERSHLHPHRPGRSDAHAQAMRQPRHPQPGDAQPRKDRGSQQRRHPHPMLHLRPHPPHQTGAAVSRRAG